MTRKRWIWLPITLVLIGTLILAVIWFFVFIYPFRNGI